MHQENDSIKRERKKLSLDYFKSLFNFSGGKPPKREARDLPKWKVASRKKSDPIPAPKLANSHQGVFAGHLNYRRAFTKIIGGSQMIRKVLGKVLIGSERRRNIQYKHRDGFDRSVPTQHQRVVKGRARRMKITVQEYERRFVE